MGRKGVEEAKQRRTGGQPVPLRAQRRPKQGRLPHRRAGNPSPAGIEKGIEGGDRASDGRTQRQRSSPPHPFPRYAPIPGRPLSIEPWRFSASVASRWPMPAEATTRRNQTPRVRATKKPPPASYPAGGFWTRSTRSRGCVSPSTGKPWIKGFGWQWVTRFLWLPCTCHVGLERLRVPRSFNVQIQGLMSTRGAQEPSPTTRAFGLKPGLGSTICAQPSAHQRSTCRPISSDPMGSRTKVG